MWLVDLIRRLTAQPPQEVEVEAPSVETLAREIVEREGGFVNDPDDPGGATKYGVTIGTMRRLRIDIDGDGDTDIHDVMGLTKEHAVQIFMDEYYRRPKIDLLPVPLQASVFDMYVNAGGNAVKILQRLMARYGILLSDDGAIGPKTAAAAHRAYDMDPDGLVDLYGMRRRDYYYSLADRRPASRKYARRNDGGKGGWIVRAEEFISPANHMTLAQHKARTAAWG